MRRPRTKEVMRNSHGIRIPGILLDSIREKDENGDYSDRKYGLVGGGKKSAKKSAKMAKSRKEMRQAQRHIKKQKRLKLVVKPNKAKQSKLIQAFGKEDLDGGTKEPQNGTGTENSEVSHSDYSDFDSDLESASENKTIDTTATKEMKNDEREMQFYAKKLGLKGKSLNKTGDDDVIGGLLEGLDFDQNGPFSPDDSISEGHFDSASDSDNDEAQHVVPSKENPFVAPTGQKYIPPALRKHQTPEISSEIVALQRTIKSAFNKLSEANINSIVAEINTVYMSHPRQIVHETITNIVVTSIIDQERLLDTFVYLHGCVVTAIYRLQGVEFGAHFIQTLIDKFDTLVDTKPRSNIISLLSSVYGFQLVSCKLVYDIIRVLIKDFHEANAEILLKLIRTSGNQIRTDDPTALKDIITDINKVTPKNSVFNARTQFLIETINSLKNHKLKTHDNSQELVIRLRRFLGTLSSHKSNDSIRVGLDDIRNIESRGKWWLVGSAWKGQELQEELQEELQTRYQDNELDLGSAEPNWIQIAKDQRMNTDIRRAIFISIMSAQDYVEALTKLDKLNLSRNQQQEIPKILVHCVSIESGWNPYYGIVAQKLCDGHTHRKLFQFGFWDAVKQFEGSEADDFAAYDTSDSHVTRIYNLGRFYGYLLSEGSLPLHSLNTINFVVISSDTKLFLEIMFVTFFQYMAKKCKASDEKLVQVVIKIKDEPGLIKGLQYFITTLENSSFVDRKQQKRVKWGVMAMGDIMDQLSR